MRHHTTSAPSPHRKSSSRATGVHAGSGERTALAPEIRLVETHNEVPDFQPSKKSVARLFGLLDTYPARAIPPGDLSIAFLDDAALSALHEKYLDDPTPTDVITFPGDTAPAPPEASTPPPPPASSSAASQPEEVPVEPPAFTPPPASAARQLAPAPAASQPPPFAGEICISIPQARRAAVLHGNTVQDEILLYLVHGWLHLTGLDDHTDEDLALMRTAERHALSWLHAHHFKPAWSA